MSEQARATNAGHGPQAGLSDAATAGTPRTGRAGARARHLFAITVLVGLVLLLWVARAELGPYVLGLLLAYMLLPVVHLIEGRLPAEGRLGSRRRSVAVLLTAALTLVAVAVLISVLLEPVTEQTADLLKGLSTYWNQLLAEYQTFGDWYEANLPDETRAWIEENVGDIGQAVIGESLSLVGFLFSGGGSVVAGLAAMVVAPLFAVYFLLDEQRIPERMRQELPEGWAEDVVAVYRLANGILGTYTRGVLVEAVIVGVITGFGYRLIGVDLFLPLGFIAFAGEIVPILGPWIAFFISFPVVLATQPELAIPAVVLFVVIQALEGWFLAPRIQGQSVDFSASATLLILALGGALGGGLGVVLALPSAALIRALIVYVMRRLRGLAPVEAAVGLIPGEKRPASPAVAGPAPAARSAAEIAPQPGTGRE